MEGMDKRIATLAGAALAVFGVSVIILLKLLPQRRTEADYLIIGSVATLIALAVLFAMLTLTGSGGKRDVFFKRRPKGG